MSRSLEVNKMNLRDMLPNDLDNKLKVTLKNGIVRIGRYIGYNRGDEDYDDDGNEIGIDSITIDTGDKTYWGLYEDEIESIETA